MNPPLVSKCIFYEVIQICGLVSSFEQWKCTGSYSVFAVFVGKLLTTHHEVYHDWSFSRYRCEWNLKCVCQGPKQWKNQCHHHHQLHRKAVESGHRSYGGWEKIASRNSLESYGYSVKQAAEEPNVDNKLNTADLETVKEKTEEVIAWLERNSLQADKEEYEEKQKDLQRVRSPIMAKLQGQQ